MGAMKEYELPGQYEVHTVDSVRMQLAGHFQLIKSLGFNSMRVPLDRMEDDDDDGRFYYLVSGRKVYLKDNHDALIEAVDGYLDKGSRKSGVVCDAAYTNPHPWERD